MPKRAQSTLSGLIEVSSDEESQSFQQDIVPTPESLTEKMGDRKVRGKSGVTASKITKSKAPSRRISAARSAAGKTNKRKVLGERPNQQEVGSDAVNSEDAENTADTAGAEVASADELDASMSTMKRTHGRATRAKVPRSEHDLPSNNENDSWGTRGGEAVKKNSQKTGRQLSTSNVNDEISETQVSTLEIDTNDDIEQSSLEPVVRRSRLARAASQIRQPSVIKRRAGSVSDTERSDPATRRKLGEMTKKLENLDLKYRNLREISVREGEHNFERLKKQHEESSRAAAMLITSLRADLAAQNTQIKEAKAMAKRAQTQDEEILKLQEAVAQLTSSLSDAQAENKTLAMKLAANRSAAATIESGNSKLLGNTTAPSGGARMIGSVEAAQAAQTAQLKEDLYSDLTGLIIRGVKREAEEDVYDCLQTGRNGTLHFKLAVTSEKSAENFEDAQGTYIPQLDPSRDKALMDMLPDYLVEEIYFPRPQAAKFYARVFKALTEKQA